jgi:hypothetical protein
MFFPANYSFRERKNLQEMHFKTEGTGSTAYIRTSKVHGDGKDDERRNDSHVNTRGKIERDKGGGGGL